MTPISEEMTARERLTAALEGQPVDRLPFSPFLAYVWEHMPADIQARGQLAFLHEVGADPMWRGAACPVRQLVPGLEVRQTEDDAHVRVAAETPVGTLHSTWVKSGAGNTSFLCEHPIKTAADLDVQLWIEEHSEFEVDLTEVEAHLAGDGCEGLSIGMLLPRGKTSYQHLVEHLMGTEELIYALADYPERVEGLLEAMVANDLRAAELAVEAPYTYYLTWEDSSTQNYSPAYYDRYIGPEIAALCALLARSGKRYVQHACGHVRALLPRMVATGVHAVESISSPPTGNVSMGEARAMVGADLGIIGGIEPTAFLRLDLPELEAYIEQVIAECLGGPFVLANSDSCPPGVTPAKFKLAAEVAHRHRLPDLSSAGRGASAAG